MPAKKKTQKKRPIVRTVLLSFAALMVITLTFFLTKSFYQEQQDRQLLNEQKVRLDAAEEDIKSISENFLAQFTSQEVNTREYGKDCGESSTKYGRGTISCGPHTFARVYTERPYDQLISLESSLQTTVNGVTSFESRRAPYVDDHKYTAGRLYSLSSSYQGIKNTDCFTDMHIYTSNEYKTESSGAEDSQGKNVITLSNSCRETTKEPIYPLRN